MLWGNTLGGGQVAVVEMNEDGCSGDTVYLAVTINGEAAGIDTRAGTEELLIFPNPFNQSTRVKFTNEEKASFELVIYDMLGNKVRIMEGITTNEVLIEKGSLTPGEYFIELKGEARTFRGRIMVE